MTGVAYGYRGHYLYGPLGNPIEPVSFSTKTGIQIRGILDPNIPPYNKDAEDLVDEEEVAHLLNAGHHFLAEKKEENAQQEVQSASASTSTLPRSPFPGSVDLRRELAHRQMASTLRLSPLFEGSTSESEARDTAGIASTVGTAGTAGSLPEDWMDKEEMASFVKTISPACTIHGEGCEGEVAETNITERARQGTGFRDLYPSVEGENGEKMVDWKKLYDEEKDRHSSR